MSLAAAAPPSISYIHTFRSSPCLACRLKPPKPFSFQEFATSKPVGLGAFLSRMSDFEKFKSLDDSKPMIEMSRAAALRSSDGDENGRCVETQTLLRNGSSEVGRELELGWLESALNRSSKWLVSALFGAIIIWKHDAEAMWAAMGAVTNSSLSITLKRVLNQQRPDPTLRSDPGMPSSHAQSIFYAVVFAVFSLVEWLGINAFSLTAGALLLISGSYFVRNHGLIYHFKLDLDIWPFLAVMATGLTATSYYQSSCCWCSTWIHFFYYVVLVMGYIRLSCIQILLMG